jgi:integrase
MSNPDVERFVSYVKMRSQSEHRERVLHDYLTTLSEFCQLVGKSPPDILDEEEIDNKLSRRERHHPIRSYLTAYIDYLKQRGMKHNIIATRCAILKTWLKSNEFFVPFFAPRPQLNYEPIRLTKPLVLEAYLRARTLRDRVIIHTLASTGLCISDLCKLNRSGLQEQED